MQKTDSHGACNDRPSSLLRLLRDHSPTRLPPCIRTPG